MTQNTRNEAKSAVVADEKKALFDKLKAKESAIRSTQLVLANLEAEAAALSKEYDAL